MKERFPSSELHKNSSAEAGHFKREVGNTRDKFGNRLFLSPDLAYLDRYENPIKAGILISKEGEVFLKKNPGILGKLDEALREMAKRGRVTLDGNIELKYYGRGGQSDIFMFTCGEEKYIIKTHQETAIEGGGQDGVDEEYELDQDDRLDQPYTNEMLQTQALAEDLREELKVLRVEMAPYIFASGQVACQKYYADSYQGFDNTDRNNLRELGDIVTSYIYDKQHQNDPLWKGIEADNPSNSFTANRNFIKQEDGTLVWIDPFKLDTTPREPGRRYG